MIYKQSSRRLRFLILGGAGLVGRCIVKFLLKKGFQNIAVVTFGNRKEKTELSIIEDYYKINIKKYLYNLLVPYQLRHYDFKTILHQKDFKKDFFNYLEQDLDRKKINRTVLYRIIKDFRPHYIIDTVNIATKCSYINFTNDRIKDAGIGLLILSKYFQILNHLLNNKFWQNQCIKMSLLAYVKVGTTGIGGMGLNIPFTHGEERPSVALIKKVMLAGAQTNALFAIKNNKSGVSIKEVIPATAIFDIDKFISTSNIGPNKVEHVELDGGESGGYAIEEFSLLTDRTQMGFIDTDNLIKIIFNELFFNKSSRDVLVGIDKTVIKPPSGIFSFRQKIIKHWQTMQKKNNIKCIAHGKLGPNKLRKLLFEAKIFGDFWKSNPIEFFLLKPSILSRRISSFLFSDYLLKKEIDYSGLSIRYNDKFNADIIPKKYSEDLTIDLSEKNTRIWQRRFNSLGFNKKRNKISTPGEILAQLIKQYHDLRAIP